MMLPWNAMAVWDWLHSNAKPALKMLEIQNQTDAYIHSMCLTLSFIAGPDPSCLTSPCKPV